LWFGNDNELGHTLWQTVDSSVISGVGAQLLKYGFGRARPSQGDNPNAWFKGSHYQSFPSGEVTLQASFVTPFIANYARQNPWVWSLEILPAYDAVARLKSQALREPLRYPSRFYRAACPSGFTSGFRICTAK
jgi:undecaprenyl-diphosphatase